MANTEFKNIVEEESEKFLEEVRVANEYCNADYKSGYYKAVEEFKNHLLKL